MIKEASMPTEAVPKQKEVVDAELSPEDRTNVKNMTVEELVAAANKIKPYEYGSDPEDQELKRQVEQEELLEQIDVNRFRTPAALLEDANAIRDSGGVEDDTGATADGGMFDRTFGNYPAKVDLRAYLIGQLAESSVLIFTEAKNKYGQQIEAFFREHSIPTKVINLSDAYQGINLKIELCRLTNQKGLPQIFIGCKLIRGSIGFQLYVENGQLEKMLTYSGIKHDLKPVETVEAIKINAEFAKTRHKRFSEEEEAQLEKVDERINSTANDFLPTVVREYHKRPEGWTDEQIEEEFHRKFGAILSKIGCKKVDE